MPTRHGAASPEADPPVLGEAAWAAAAPTLLFQPALWPVPLPPGRSPNVAPPGAEPPDGPWGQYWWARARLLSQPAAARRVLDLAWQRLSAPKPGPAAAAIEAGPVACAVAAIESFYFDETDLQPLADWVWRLEQALARGGWPEHDMAQAHLMRCGPGLAVHRLSHPLLLTWAQAAPTLLPRLTDAVDRARVASFVLVHHLLRGLSAQVGWVLDALPALDAATLAPDDALLWHDSVARHARSRGNWAQAHRANAQALRIAARQRWRDVGFPMRALAGYIAIAQQDAPATRRHLQAMQRLLTRSRLADTSHYWHLQAGLAVLEQAWPQALALARLTLAQSESLGGASHLAVHRFSVGTVLLASGQPEEALPALAAAEQLAQDLGAGQLLFSVRLLRSSALADTDQGAAADALLREAMRAAAQDDVQGVIGWPQPDRVAQRLARALTLGLQPAHARRLAQTLQLAGPDPQLASWPWPLALHGLGRLHIDPPQARPPLQGRPLELLLALASRDGDAPATTLMDMLWPHADAEAQRQAFDTNLLRLRRWLADPRLLTLAQGQLRFDPRWVWTDLQALHAATTQALQIAHPQRPADGPSLWHAAETLLARYTGPWLPHLDTPWARVARERLRQRWVGALAQVAGALASQDAGGAARLYERAIETDPLAETLYRHLIRLHGERGHHAEALRAWQMATALLTLGSGQGPSPDTRALARRYSLPNAG